MHQTHSNILIAAVLLTVVVLGGLSTVGIVFQDAPPTRDSGRLMANVGTSSHPASPGDPSGPIIDLVDIAFQPRVLTIPANTPTVVTLVNQGAVAHNFTIDALNVHSGNIQPGQSTAVTIDATAGTYTYYCAIPGHRAAGMVGTLTVK